MPDRTDPEPQITAVGEAAEGGTLTAFWLVAIAAWGVLIAAAIFGVAYAGGSVGYIRLGLLGVSALLAVVAVVLLFRGVGRQRLNTPLAVVAAVVLVPVMPVANYATLLVCSWVVRAVT